MKLLHSFVFAVSGLVSLPLAAFALLLFVESATTAGRVVAVAVMLTVVTLLGAVFALGAMAYRRRKPVLQFVAVALVATLAIWAVAVRLAPDGQSEAGARFRSVWLGGGEPGRLSLVRLLPEIDQVLVALWFMPYVDDTATVEGTKRLRAAFQEIYHGMQAQTEFARAGSVLGGAYASRLERPWREGHLYAYIPEGEDDSPMPVVLYLHGAAGNLKGAAWVWKRFADRHRVAVLLPSCGAGDWDSEAGDAAIGGALRFIDEQSRLDPDRVLLAGHGIGAGGIPRAVVKHEGAFKRLVFIAPVMDSARIRGKDFLEQAAGLPVLVLHADQDLRSPIADVRRDTEWMGEHGIDAATVTFPDEDHDIFWKRGDAVMERLRQWLGF